MKKLILAISGVFCLQFGFIAYNAGDPAADTSFITVDDRVNDIFLSNSVAEPFADGQIIADLPTYDSEESESIRIVDSGAAEPVFSPIRSSSRVPPSKHKRRELNTFVAQENLAELKPVSVTYSTHDSVQFKQYALKKQRTEYPGTLAVDSEVRHYELMAKPLTRTKRKNLFARVMKAPYNWLKAIGSTFRDTSKN